MTGQQLKNSILQLAIQGKLVPQNPDDEPASELLKRIRKEKEKLVKEKKIKKEKPLPEISEDEKPFEIPDNWVWVRWGDLSYSIQYGYNAPAKEIGRIRMVRISDIQNNKVMWETVPFCDICEKEIDTYTLRKNDILFARTGGTVGKSFLVDEVPYESVYAGYLIRTRYNNELSPKYLKFFMESKLYWEQLKNGTIATAQPNCNGQTLSKMVLPLPPLQEQHRIVEKIEELMPLVDKYDKAQKELNTLNANLPEALKKSILQEAIQGKLGTNNPDDEPASELLKRIRAEKEKLVKEKKLKKSALDVTPISEDEKPFEIPEGWEWCRLDEISLDSADGPFGSNLKREHYTENREVRIIQLSNIGELGWKDANVRYTTFEHLPNISRSEAFAGDIIIAKMMPAGRAIICPNHESKFVLSSDAVRFDFSDELYKKYLYYAINSSVFKVQVYGQVQGITRVRTSLNKLRTYILPLPPLQEQHRIVEKLNELLPKLETLK